MKMLEAFEIQVRCPDCIDGPIPGCQWDYDCQTEWKWKTCQTCDGSGKVSTANNSSANSNTESEEKDVLF